MANEHQRPCANRGRHANYLQWTCHTTEIVGLRRSVLSNMTALTWLVTRPSRYGSLLAQWLRSHGSVVCTPKIHRRWLLSLIVSWLKVVIPTHSHATPTTLFLDTLIWISWCSRLSDIDTVPGEREKRLYEDEITRDAQMQFKLNSAYNFTETSSLD